MKRFLTKRLLVVPGVALALLLVLSFIFLHVENFPYHERFRLSMKDRLARTNVLEHRHDGARPVPKSVIYVMGGHQFNLRYRFRIAAALYGRGLAEGVFVLSRPGITEYEPDLERNLSKDEWARRTLEEHGIKPEDIKLLTLKKEGFFGTLSEAREVAELIEQNGYKRLFVVSSLPHTGRVWLCFSREVGVRDVELYVYGTDDPIGLKALLKEYMKLMVYRVFLLR